MKTIRELYKLGNGPSSSHTIGPHRICKDMLAKYPKTDKVEVTLYGSLALTGKGHRTDGVIIETLSPIPTKVNFDFKTKNIEHPNTMDVTVYEKNKKINTTRYFSIGGGSFLEKGKKEPTKLYKHKNFNEIANYCKKNKLNLAEYIYHFEDKKIKDFIWEIWNSMVKTIDKGLKATGFINSDAKYKRTANIIFNQKDKNEDHQTKMARIVSSYAIAINEENASGGIVLTSPTCGAAGVLPAVIKFLADEYKLSKNDIIDCFAVAAVIGNILKTNGSISGAEAGCQAEIGSACSMAAAAVSFIKYNADISEIEQAAMIAMQHHLGLTCDPVNGYVIIPCIQRNGVAALRAFDSASIAHLSKKIKPTISFDQIVQTMKKTGNDLAEQYRETSLGGLACFAKNSVNTKK